MWSFCSHSDRRVRLQVETKLESRPTYSVSGTIFGDVEPGNDRIIQQTLTKVPNHVSLNETTLQ